MWNITSQVLQKNNKEMLVFSMKNCKVNPHEIAVHFEDLEFHIFFRKTTNFHITYFPHSATFCNTVYEFKFHTSREWLYVSVQPIKASIVFLVADWLLCSRSFSVLLISLLEKLFALLSQIHVPPVSIQCGSIVLKVFKDLETLLIVHSKL